MKIKRFFKKIADFFKRNAYYVILFLCISGIATMITLASINGANNIDDNKQIIKDDDNDIIDDDDDDDDQDVVAPPIIFALPVADYEEGMLYSANNWVYMSTLKDYRTHKAMDFITEESVGVMACFDGVVDSVYYNTREGNVVVIKHNNELSTTYKSLSNVKVEEGYNVKKGDLIGYTSDSMMNELLEGKHLHLEALFKGKLVNPTDFLDTGDK